MWYFAAKLIKNMGVITNMAARIPGFRTCKQREKAKQWLWFFGLYFGALGVLALFSYIAHMVVPHA